MNIKRIFIFILALVIFAGCLASCKKETGEGESAETSVKMCTVKFNTNCETVIEPRSIRKGDKIGEPDIPKNEGYVYDKKCEIRGMPHPEYRQHVVGKMHYKRRNNAVKSDVHRGKYQSRNEGIRNLIKIQMHQREKAC